MTPLLKKHLFVSDMDGTLLGPDSLVSAESAELITELSKRGFPVTVATARTPATVDVLLENTYTDIPAIVMTGAALWERNMDRYINPVLFDEDIARELLAAFAESGVHPFIYVLDGGEKLTVYHPVEMNRQETEFYEERRHLKGKRFVLGESAPLTKPQPGMILAFAMGDARKIEAVADRLRGIRGLSVSCYRDIFNKDIANLEIFGAGVSKAKAIRWLADKIGAERITVYGDNLNDLPMFEIADDAVAVANAMPEVLERADRVIGPNGASSVARDMYEQAIKESVG
ncbi:HAD family hydrolase [uncultured Duncaniella sp.]|uniref:HAD-IIB family hydrolase n=1 Tax=uncultured Duncaniella sp. TaxID=2768039 RepID=UPI0025FB6096|nr:HAD family hydrolase [uncultured Duncaniella sp.]